jgi:hypothetical protein
MRTLAFVTASLVLGTLVTACAAPADPAPPNEKVAAAREPIVAGSLDTTHQAVVAVLGTQSACTGTIIQLNGSIGYALTAAHCCAAGSPPKYIVQGNDYNAQGTAVYPVSEYKAHPAYDSQNPGSPDDFCVVRFSGATASTPVIPAMTQALDDLATGVQVEVVGYGLTSKQDQDNSERRHANVTLSNVSSLQFGFNFNPSGICSGDSGGPALRVVGGKEYVAGVASFSDQDCAQYGGEGRVSAVYDSFIMNYINGLPTTLTCDECSASAQSDQGACADSIDACINHAGCNALATCFNECPDNDQACIDGCVDTNPTGLTKYLAIFECTCKVGCPSECGDTPNCKDMAPNCGFSSSDTTCNTCLQTTCCAEAADCSSDATCITCFSDSPASGCSSNGPAKAFNQCMSDGCADECGFNQTTTTSTGTGTGTGAGGSIGTGGGGTGTATGVGGNGAGGATNAGGAGGGTATNTGSPGNGWAGVDEDEADPPASTDGGCSLAGPTGGQTSLPGLPLLGLGLGLALAARRRKAS